MKGFILTILLLLLASSAFAENYSSIKLSHNYQRPGGDYSNFYLKNVQKCSQKCLQDQRCKAFDFHKSDRSCWLKNKSYPARKYHGCISGRKQWNHNRQVVSVQRFLAVQNYNPGPPDGLLGKKTKIALKNYQIDHGLPATGEIDKATLIALQLAKVSKIKRNDNFEKEVTSQQYSAPVATANDANDSGLGIGYLRNELSGDAKPSGGLTQSVPVTRRYKVTYSKLWNAVQDLLDEQGYFFSANSSSGRIKTDQSQVRMFGAIYSAVVSIKVKEESVSFRAKFNKESNLVMGGSLLEYPEKENELRQQFFAALDAMLQR